MQENEPQVVLILNSKADGLPKQGFMEQIAKYYNLPIINVASAIQPEIASGRMHKDKFYIDEYNVTQYGESILSKFIENYIKQADKTKKETSYNIPSRMYTGGNFTNIKFIPAEDIKTDNSASYTKFFADNKYFPYRIKYMHNSGNIPLLYTLKASNIWIISPVASDRKDIAEIYINGKKTMQITSNAKNIEDIPNVYKIFSSDHIEDIAVGIIIKEESEKSAVEDNANESRDSKKDNEEEINPDSLSRNSDRSFEIWGMAYRQ